MMINKYILLRNSLFISLAVYFAQGSLYSTGSIVGKLSLLAILLVSSYFCVKSVLLRVSKPVLYYSLLALLLINVIGFTINGVYSGTYFSQMRNILTALLPFFSFYFLAQKGYLDDKHLVRFFILMLPIAIASYYFSRNAILLERLSDSQNVVTNSAYLFVSLLPFVFFWGQRKIFAIASLIIIVFFTIQGAKRGAVIAGAVGIVVYLYYELKNIPANKKAQGYLLTTVCVVAVIAYAIHLFEGNEYLLGRMESLSEGGSGRNRIYTSLLLSWYNSNDVLNYLFGFGFVATIQNSGTGHLAHNDWLELLTNFGLLGVSIYLLLFISIARYSINPRISKRDRLAMIALAGIWFLQTLFSMYYTSSSTAITMVVLGYLVGRKTHYKHRNLTNV